MWEGHCDVIDDPLEFIEIGFHIASVGENPLARDCCIVEDQSRDLRSLCKLRRCSTASAIVVDTSPVAEERQIIVVCCNNVSIHQSY